MKNFWLSATAVSYTHLDVYKRQGFQVWSLSSLRKMTEEGVTFASHIDGSRPVSYTHLDVYKRQGAAYYMRWHNFFANFRIINR